MESVKVIIDSLGNYSVSMLDGVREIRIFVDEDDRTAHMEICLDHDTWARRERVIDQMVEVREMFIDDVAISYAFGASEARELAEAEGARSLVYAG